MNTPLLDGIRKIARMSERDLIDQSLSVEPDVNRFSKRLEPGDILLFKPSDRAKMQKTESSPSRGFVQGTGVYSNIKRMFNRGSNWDHAGIYIGDGKSLHVYPKMNLGDRGYNPADSYVRVHSLKTLAGKHKRDVLAVRPDVSKEQRQRAVEIAKSFKGERFSKKDLVLTALAPWAAKGDPGAGEGTICSGIVATAYPDIDFRGGLSRRVVRPSDLHYTSRVREIAALSLDRE